MSNLLEYAQKLGLTEQDLDEAIHDIMSDRASDINNGGMRAQMEFLQADYCGDQPQIVRAFLDQLAREKQDD